MQDRDYNGYGGKLPHPRWPGGAHVAVSIVVNFEEGAEFSVTSGDGRNEAVYEVTDEIIGARDRCMESHYEYGTRAGYWRIMDVLDRHQVVSTVSACGRAVETSPALARDAVTRGHEVSCHGYRWEKHATMPEAEERAAIVRTVAAIERATGVRPVGWHTRSTPSPNTRRLLVEQGFLYDSDDYGDDLPFYVEVAGHPYLVVPYAFDTNDMNFHWAYHSFVTARHFVEYVSDAFDALWREGAHAPKMMSIGLHLRIIGRPGRIAGLEQVLTHMQSKGQVWFARRRDIAEHWLKQFPKP